MKSDKNILLAFLLNFIFAIIEFIGGTVTGSVAIISDSIHDLGDSLSIGTSFILEKISMKKPDEKHTYGYYRYSVLGGVIQSSILLCGSILVIYNAIIRLINPTPINYNGMIIISIIGFITNLVAAYFTSGGESLNQKAINLHMLEDVLGWASVLIGAIIMRFTDWFFIDAVLSIALAVFIIVNSIKGIKAVLDIFLEKTPHNICINELKEHLYSIDGVINVHHIHIWSMDGFNTAATLHIVTDNNISTIKNHIKEELKEHGIAHSTIEFESSSECCNDINCNIHTHTHPHTHNHNHNH